MTLAQPSPSTESASPSYQGVGRQAWILLWGAFAIFVCLLIGIPLGVRWYIQYAAVPLSASVETVRGTTLVVDGKSTEPVGVTGTRELLAGSIIRTDDLSRANLSITNEDNDALGTVQLRNNSELLLEDAETPRFGGSDQPNQIDLKLNLGRARVTGLADNGRAQIITVRTPHGLIRVSDGDAAIAVSNALTEVNARSGAVEIESQGKSIVLNEGQRSTLALDQPPSAPQESAVNLVKNGDFTEPLDGTWEVETLVDAKDTSNVTFGKASIVPVLGRNAVYFNRQAPGDDANLHSETAIVQDIDADVLDYDSLILRLDARLISQNLPGAGQQSSEFPLMVRIDFVDVNGNERFWTWGFYMTDPENNWPIRDGEKIPALTFYDFESPDFLNSPTFPRPAKVKSIRVYGSGHNYQSQASGIGLIAK